MATLKHAACVVVVVAAAVVAALAGAAVAAVAAVAVVAAAPVWDKPICEETIINYHQLPIKTQTTSFLGAHHTQPIAMLLDTAEVRTHHCGLQALSTAGPLFSNQPSFTAMAAENSEEFFFGQQIVVEMSKIEFEYI